jgi:putative addiction module component (TIGR02574 family)
MARNLKELFHEAAQLPSSDRATLAGLLIESLEPAPEPDVEAAWSEEIARRVTELDAGTVETIPWEEVHAELFGRRNERQIPSSGLR